MVQATTAEIPSVIVQASNVLIHVRRPRIGYRASEPSANTVPVVVLSELHEFSIKVASIPKVDTVKVFTTNRSNQSLNEGMRQRCIRDGPNLIDAKNPDELLAIGDTGMAGLSLPWRWVEMITKIVVICSRIPFPLRQIVLPLPMNDPL